MIIDKDIIKLYSHARSSRDRNYDSKFFFGVKTTGIFCRPSCPAPKAKEENVVYFENIFQALEHGFRPCLRCRPDLNTEYHNSYIPGSETIQKALTLIYDGFLNYHSINELASEVCMSQRQLRKIFIDSLGIPPVKIGRYHKAVFARKLLTGSQEKISSIALGSGFRSIRQFNSAYHDIFKESPSETRSKNSNSSEESAGMLIRYKGMFNFQQILNFMQPRLIAGIEQIEGSTYMRTFRTAHAEGWFSVRDCREKKGLELQIHTDDVRCYMEVYYRVRKMFDLDTDFTLINEQFSTDPLLSPGMTNGQVPRLPAAFDPFEFVIRAVLGQQITVKAATTLAGRVAESANRRCAGSPEALLYFFPTPEELAAAEISNIGITKTRQQTIRTVTEAVIENRLSLSQNQHFDDFAADFGKLKGIGDWTVNYTAMRGLGMKDAFPAADLGIIKALTAEKKKPSIKEIISTAEKWRPYRSYAALCLWNKPNKAVME